MTIRPTASGYAMTCDGEGCRQSRPVGTIEAVRWAERIGWTKRPHGKGPAATIKHYCPRCTAADRRSYA